MDSKKIYRNLSEVITEFEAIEPYLKQPKGTTKRSIR